MKQLLLVFILVSLTSHAQAATVRFDFSSTCCGIDASDMGQLRIPGIAPGQSFNISIFADNGGQSLTSQYWGSGDYQSAVATIGDGVYGVTLDAVGGFFNASTDAAGNILSLMLSDTLGNTDTLGSLNPGLIVNGARNVVFANDFLVADADDTTGPENWHASMFQVPVPTTLALFWLGLVSLGWLKRGQRAHSC